MFLDPQNVQSIKLTGPSNWFPALSEKSIKMGSVISTAGIYWVELNQNLHLLFEIYVSKMLNKKNNALYNMI